jgi:hypothetical protein
MARIGVNVDPLNPAGAPTPQALQAAGFTWVRLVSRPGVESYVSGCLAANVNVLAVIARESFDPDGLPHVLVPPPTMYQFGNEPDGAGVSSWTMDQDTYVSWWNTWAGKLGAPVIAAGLASDDSAGWVSPVIGALDPQPHALAVHAYGLTPATADGVFTPFAALGLPIWLTEWNPLLDWNAATVSPEVAAIWDVFDSKAEAAFWFCWSDGMVDGLGLLDAQGAEKMQYRTLTALQVPSATVNV